MEWGAALPSTVGWLSPAGKESVGMAALQGAVQAAHAPTKEPLAVRTWEAQGGPRRGLRSAAAPELAEAAVVVRAAH